MSCLLAQVTPSTPPTQLIVFANPVTDQGANYSFEVVLSHYRYVDGVPQIRATTTVVRSIQGQLVRFKDIIQYISPDATSFTLLIDGRKFTLEASYQERSEFNGEIRDVVTTFGKMFNGGQVGIKARVGS